jgi:hypothetical protein
MKMKVFVGKIRDVEVIFNNWAKGKALTREVLIHTHPLPPLRQGEDDWLAVIVIHPEDPQWDKTEPTPTTQKMVDQHIAGHQSAIEVPA